MYWKKRKYVFIASLVVFMAALVIWLSSCAPMETSEETPFGPGTPHYEVVEWDMPHAYCYTWQGDISCVAK